MFSKGGKRRPRALRHLALQELGLAIQEGEHSSVDDARAGVLQGWSAGTRRARVRRPLVLVSRAQTGPEVLRGLLLFLSSLWGAPT